MNLLLRPAYTLTFLLVRRAQCFSVDKIIINETPELTGLRTTKVDDSKDEEKSSLSPMLSIRDSEATSSSEPIIPEKHVHYKECKKLVDAGFSPTLSLRLVEMVDSIAHQKANELNSFYLTLNEYDMILKVYHNGIEKFFTDSQTIQKSHFESVRNSYAHLSTSTASVHELIMEEIKGLESGMLLDMNLEKKKTNEALNTVNELSARSDGYMKKKMDDVKSDLTFVEKHARTAIIGNSY
jgi:Protein of unknown function (DUF1640)